MYIDNHINVLDNSSTYQTEKSAQENEFLIQLEDDLGNRHLIYPVVFNNFVWRKDERVQILNGFNEVAHLYAFGKNPDQLQLSGYVFASNKDNPRFQNTPGLITNSFDKTLRAYKAAEQGIRTKIAGPQISGKGSTILKGVSNQMNISLDASITSIMSFSINFIGVDSVMGIGDEPPNKKTPSKATTSIMTNRVKRNTIKQLQNDLNAFELGGTPV